jgi:hypothetical protein
VAVIRSQSHYRRARGPMQRSETRLPRRPMWCGARKRDRAPRDGHPCPLHHRRAHTTLFSSTRPAWIIFSAARIDAPPEGSVKPHRRRRIAAMGRRGEMRSPTISQPLSRVIRDVFGPSRVRRKRARLCGERSQRSRSPATRAWRDGALERICGRIRALLLGPFSVFTKSVLAARYLHCHRMVSETGEGYKGETLNMMKICGDTDRSTKK